MRVAIPSDDGRTIAAHTGRTLGFVIFDLHDNNAEQVEYRTNQYTAHALGQCTEESKPHEAHHHHSHDGLLNALHDCQVMIAKGMGQRLVDDLNQRRIQVVFCDLEVANEAAVKLAQGSLRSSGKSCCGH